MLDPICKATAVAVTESTEGNSPLVMQVLTVEPLQDAGIKVVPSQLCITCHAAAASAVSAKHTSRQHNRQCQTAPHQRCPAPQ